MWWCDLWMFCDIFAGVRRRRRRPRARKMARGSRGRGLGDENHLRTLRAVHLLHTLYNNIIDPLKILLLFATFDRCRKFFSYILMRVCRGRCSCWERRARHRPLIVARAAFGSREAEEEEKEEKHDNNKKYENIIIILFKRFSFSFFGGYYYYFFLLNRNRITHTTPPPPPPFWLVLSTRIFTLPRCYATNGKLNSNARVLYYI